MNKKEVQLGMNPSTASGRLLKDLLFKMIVDKGIAYCHRCGKELTRNTFSIDHKVDWLDSEDPKGLFFNLDNITFSHLKCNTAASRKPNKKFSSEKERDRVRHLTRVRKYDPEKRKERYRRLGT